MKPFNPRAVELAAPKQQRNWDWRAAANFICGGAGGGLLLVAAFAGLDAFATRAALLMGLALIGCGLTCVWFEIGRPWRALNVYRHAATSWMTREAFVARAVFGSGILALYFMAAVPLLLAGAGPDTTLLVLLLVLLTVRVWCWRRYLAGLTRSGAPLAALKVLDAFGPRFQTIGHGLPAVVLVAALVGLPGRSLMVLLAGLLVAASGWVMKYTLVRRAAYTQGLAVDHLPVRGRGPSGPAAKPGWKMMSGGNRG